MIMYKKILQQRRNFLHVLDKRAHVPRLVVIPAQNFHHVAIDHFDEVEWDGRAERLADDVGRDELVGRHFQNPLPALARGCVRQNLVDLFDARRALGEERDVGNREGRAGF